MQVDKTVHPALIPLMAVSSIVGLVLVVLGILYLEKIGLLVAVLVGSVFVAGGQVAFWANFLYNKNIWEKYVVRFGNVYWFDFCRAPKVKNFIFELRYLEREVQHLLGKYGERKISEPLCCFVMNPGEVFWKNKHAMGLQLNNWIKIEWRGRSISYKLARHEMMHYFLSKAMPTSSEQEQHEIMKKCIN